MRERGNGRFVRGLPTWDGLAGIRSAFRAASRRQPGGRAGKPRTASAAMANLDADRRAAARKLQGYARAIALRHTLRPAGDTPAAREARLRFWHAAISDRRRFLRRASQALRQLCQHQSDRRPHPAGRRCGHLAAIVVGALRARATRTVARRAVVLRHRRHARISRRQWPAGAIHDERGAGSRRLSSDRAFGRHCPLDRGGAVGRAASRRPRAVGRLLCAREHGNRRTCRRRAGARRGRRDEPRSQRARSDGRLRS